MLTTFTTEHGALVIRSEDLRRLEDTVHLDGSSAGCTLGWIEGEAMKYAAILGTAQENRDRLVAEELHAIAEYEAMQRRQQEGRPMLPVVRGGKVAR